MVKDNQKPRSGLGLEAFTPGSAVRQGPEEIAAADDRARAQGFSSREGDQKPKKAVVQMNISASQKEAEWFREQRSALGIKSGALFDAMARAYRAQHGDGAHIKE